MKSQNDIILVTGRNMVGKTTAIYHLKKYIDLDKIHNEIITDSQYLFESMMQDDKSGGIHHTHSWCEKSSRGHKHNSREDEPIFPFTVTDNTIPDSTFHLFFTALNNLPHINNKIYFVELAGGRNTLFKDESGSDINYSYAKIKRIYQENLKYRKWMERVRTVIHITAADETRQILKHRRLMHFPKDLAKNTASWLIDERVLQFYGYDDFFEIQGLFDSSGVTVHDIKNDGSVFFFDRLNCLSKELI